MEHQDARAKVEAEGIRLRNWSRGDYKTLCPNCSEKRKAANRKDPCLSVTIKSADEIVWMCHNCDWTGVRTTEGPSGNGTRPPVRQSEERPEPPRKPDRIESLPLDDEAIEMFDRRGIGVETLDAFNVRQFRRWMPQTRREVETIVFPYYSLGKLVNRKYRTFDKHFIQEAKTLKTLYNVDRAREADEVIIVEGEMDVLSMFEAGYPNAVSLPDGASKGGNRKRLEVLKNSGLLTDNRRFVIAGDRDEPGLALRRELVKFIGRERCSAVFWSTGQDVVCKDANDVLMLHGPEVVRECVEAAESCADGLKGRVWEVEPDPDDRGA